MTTISMPYCIICKEIVDKRYELRANDSELDNSVHGHVCRHCFNKIIESKNDVSFFKISRLPFWAKRKRDSFRL